MSFKGYGGHIGGYFVLVDNDDGDSLRTSQKRCGIMQGTRGQAASIPGDADMFRLKRPFVRIRNKNDRTASLKKHLLRYGVIERVAVRFWLEYDRQVVESRQGAYSRRDFGRTAHKRLNTISDACVPGFRFKHRERGLGPRQCAFVIDLKHSSDRSATIDG